MPPSPHQERRLRYRADARQAILDAADRLLDEHGTQGFSMRELAARCRCTAPTIYHYFRDKPGLIATVLEARLERLVEEMLALPASADPVATLRMRAAAFALFGVRHPGHYQLLMAEGSGGVEGRPVSEQGRQVFDDAFEELVRAGELAKDDVEMLRQAVWSLVHGFILLQTTRPGEEWEPNLLDRSLDALIRGSLRRSARA